MQSEFLEPYMKKVYSVADLEKFVGGGPNICWVAGRLVIGDNFGSHSRSVVIHVVS